MPLNRRAFLQSTSALALPVLLARTGWSAENTPKIQLGLVTYNWAKDWNIPTLIKNCTEAGFAGVELRTEHAHGVELKLTAHERKEVRKRFADSPVAIVGLGSTCEYHSADPAVVQKNIEETKAFVDLAHDIGASGVKVRPNGFTKGVPEQTTLEQIGKSLRTVGEYADQFGQDIRLEVHGKGTQEPPNTKVILDVADHKRAVACWNCNPTDLKGLGFQKNFDLLKNRIRTVHIHDLTKDNYPWKELFQNLKTLPTSQVWTLIEDNDTSGDLVARMKDNRKAWDELMKS
ncbi:sugar phosphate isomerase/epimerase family protein [Planctomicrobium sp. SH664]|uniref:sugar phosphate isomerase/epimerase family protein n=1 Tax=Planctomicrobium sp. SH664 TaxID=3448125 RepID=UPI003F5BA0B1